MSTQFEPRQPAVPHKASAYDVKSFGDGVYALQHPLSVDGTLPWFPGDVRGVSTSNCYVVMAEGEALLIDTGLTVHRKEILANLKEVLGKTPLSIVLTRIGEFAGICNAIPILQAVNVKKIFAQQSNILERWIRFVPEDFDSEGIPAPGSVEEGRLPYFTTLDLGTGPRPVDIFMAALRLLPTYWTYDGKSKTLFTSDAFSYGMVDPVSNRSVITEANDNITKDHVYRHMVEDRYWWVPGANVSFIREEVAKVFDRYDIHRIAPGYGAVLEGKTVVDRHHRMLDEILSKANG